MQCYELMVPLKRNPLGWTWSEENTEEDRPDIDTVAHPIRPSFPAPRVILLGTAANEDAAATDAEDSEE